jgi:hypothetical protein
MMFARLLSRRKALARLALLGVASLASACAPLATGGGPQGPALVPGEPVPVALLVPAGAGPEGDLLARNLENGARLAASDLSGVVVDLRVYPTGGDPAQAAAAAQAAVAEGAAVVLGPLYGEESAAAALAVAPQGVNVLSFSTNPAFAGNNLFILGPTFQNTADRLVSYGRGVGVERYLVTHANNDAGAAGRDAIVAAANRGGATVAAVEAYPLSQQGIAGAAPRVLAAASAAGAQAIFTTADATLDLPALASGLSEAGYVAGTPRLVGLTRWNTLPENLSLPALQGGLFAVPDQGRLQAFEARYRAAYGEAANPVAALAYDGIAAIGALAAQGDAQALSRRSLTQGQGFQGTSGIFRLNDDGTNARGLAVAEIRNNQVVIVDPAPSSFAGAGL